jgi:hypothetical protein
MPATAATIYDIIRSGGGVIDLSGGRWAIYSYDSVLGGNPVDFETYIYTGSGPPISKSIVHSNKVSILNSCILKILNVRILRSTLVVFNTTKDIRYMVRIIWE